MHFSRISRKKRLLLLQTEPAPQKTLKLLKGMWSPPTDDERVRERKWFLATVYSHSAFCGCNDPVGHLCRLATLSNRPENPGPSGGRRAPSIGILPALPAATEQPGDRAPWPMGGGGDAAEGGRDGGEGPGGDAHGGPADADLLDAVDAAEQ
uniref:Hepatitis TT virus Orf2/Gyrovirus Vp2 N-terminal domain-containing protein n=1 Tax=Torque teno virus TaxID=68887 RepID=Q9QUE2_9VIRU|nr:unknown [Torque teno virus]